MRGDIGVLYIDGVNGLIGVVSLRSAIASDVDISFRNEEVAFRGTLGVQANLNDMRKLGN